MSISSHQLGTQASGKSPSLGQTLAEVLERWHQHAVENTLPQTRVRAVIISGVREFVWHQGYLVRLLPTKCVRPLVKEEVDDLLRALRLGMVRIWQQRRSDEGDVERVVLHEATEEPLHQESPISLSKARTAILEAMPSPSPITLPIGPSEAGVTVLETVSPTMASVCRLEGQQVPWRMSMIQAAHRLILPLIRWRRRPRKEQGRASERSPYLS